jgi:hypothetical protein
MSWGVKDYRSEVKSQNEPGKCTLRDGKLESAPKFAQKSEKTLVCRIKIPKNDFTG